MGMGQSQPMKPSELEEKESISADEIEAAKTLSEKQKSLTTSALDAYETNYQYMFRINNPNAKSL